MSGDLGTSIILIMAPIFVLMIGLVVYGIVKNSNKNKSQSKHETDAIIEAQAMLAKYKKEQAEKESAKKEEDAEEQKVSEKNNEEKESETKEDETKKAPEEKAIEDKDGAEKSEKSSKPSVEAPIDDTTELEPDIDKTENA